MESFYSVTHHPAINETGDGGHDDGENGSDEEVNGGDIESFYLKIDCVIKSSDTAVVTM